MERGGKLNQLLISNFWGWSLWVQCLGKCWNGVWIDEFCSFDHQWL